MIARAGENWRYGAYRARRRRGRWMACTLRALCMCVLWAIWESSLTLFGEGVGYDRFPG